MFSTLDNMAHYSAALYIRLSREDLKHGESESIANQRSMLRDYCKTNGIYIHDTYIDDGYSGTNFDRPDFQRMIADIESKEVNLVITKDMSRLGRDHILVGHYMERYFPENGVRYIAIYDGVDTGLDITSNDMAPIRAVFNDMYAKDTSKKIRAALNNKKRQGLFIGSKASYGYKFSSDNSDYIVVDHEVSHIVREVFERTICGESARQIARCLASRQIETPGDYAKRLAGKPVQKARHWHSDTVARLVRHQVYMGNLVQNQRQKTNYKSRQVMTLPQEQWIISTGTHEAIVSPDEFERANRMLDTRLNTKNRTHDTLLKGIIFCKECQKALLTSHRRQSDGQMYYYYLCGTYARFSKHTVCTAHSIQEKRLTQEVLRLVRERCQHYLTTDLSKRAIAEVLAESERSNATQPEIARLGHEVERLTAQMSRMYKDRLEGLLEDIDFFKIYNDLKTQRTTKEARVKQLTLVQKKDTLTLKNLQALTEQFLDRADTNRELLISLVEKVEFSDKREVFVHFRFGGVVSAKIPRATPSAKQKKQR